jgi:UDP-N-acetylmuramoyl-L-alanyl-D-glutamate--2,6-diaminopimelate ligase
MAELRKLLTKVVYRHTGNDQCDIRTIQIDSRQVKSGDLFVAVRGSLADGHAFIDAAIQNGARAILCEDIPSKVVDGITYVMVEDSKLAAAELVQAYYDYPQQGMKIVGITGTNGKTTVATICWQMFRELQIKCGLFSTVHVKVNDDELPATHTTPDIIQLYRVLSEMREAGCEYVFMEVSSHALDQNRTAGIAFETAVFTNVSRDHLDYHGDFKSYLDAKKKLFDHLDAEALAVICADDKHADYMVQNCKARICKYALTRTAELKGRILENSLDGLLMRIGKQEVFFRMGGRYNALNLLAALAVGEEFALDRERLLESLSMVRGAEGRFETIKSKKGVYAIVDYAHSPDALDKLLKNVNSMIPAGRKCISVVGCGGDRDRGKRPLMGGIAARLSDLTILTSDNPRSEDPELIIEEMFGGIQDEQRNKVFRVASREDAIKLATTLAKQGDIIVVAGKGHEKYQEIKGEKFPFDDKMILRSYLD